jgi:hypothetical protein
LEGIKLKMGIQAQAMEQTNQTKVLTTAMANESKENMQKREKGMPEEQIQQPAGSPSMEQNIPEEEMM